MERAYNDYGLFGQWCERGVYCVAWLKDNASFEVTARREPPQNRNILADQEIQWESAKGNDKCPFTLRRIVVWDAEKNARSCC